MLTEKEYTVVFLNAGKHLNTGLISDYFEGSFNENNRTESFNLYTNGIENVYNKLKQKLLYEYSNDLTQYRLAKAIETNSDFEKPNKEYYQIHCYDYDSTLKCSYNLTDIENIYRGFLIFQAKIKTKRHFVESGITKQANNNKTKLSFHWQGNSDELTELYKKMMASKLIAQNTSEADFKAIFDAKPLDAIKQPIRWNQTKVLLAYFIHQLSIFNSKISASDNHWKIAESCFENARNLKQSNQNWQDYGKPKNHHLIDGLF